MIDDRANQLAQGITDRLRALGRGSKQGHRPSSQEDFGVYTPDLRAIVKECRQVIAKEPGQFVIDLAMSLIAMRITECRQAAYELIEGHRPARELLNEDTLEALGAGMDNWACVDGFCCTLVGRAWREGRIPDETIARWSRSDDLWWRRAVVVATVPLNTKSRGGKGDTRRTLAVCSSLVDDREEMVQKAISWALRELVPWDREAVEGFLTEYEGQVSARVRREVRNKLDHGLKNTWRMRDYRE